MALSVAQGWVRDHWRQAWYRPHPVQGFEHEAIVIRWQVDIYRVASVADGGRPRHAG